LDFRLLFLSSPMSKNINQLNRLFTFVSQQIHPRLHRSLSTFRLSTLGLLLTFNLSFFIYACGLDIEDPTPPSPPQWVQKSLPEEWPERGIDAHESGGIFMEWEQNIEENIAAYLIYRAVYFESNDSLSEYVLSLRLQIDADSKLNYLNADVTTRTIYIYKLQAEDNSGNRSGFSDSVMFLLLPHISSATMEPNGILDTLERDMILNWRYGTPVEMEDYCLTLTDQNDALIWREVFSPGNYVGANESRRIPLSVILEPERVYKWRIDTGARYVDGIETAASESPWATFLYIGE